MKLNEVKQYTLGVLRGAFTNKNILDDISAEGKNLRYKGNNLGDSYMFTGTENYIEDEQVIGRWIDGRPLYRKLYKGTGNWGSSMTNIIMESNFRNTKNYVGSKGYVDQTSNNSIPMNTAVNTSSNGIICWVVGNDLCFRNFSGGNVGAYYIFVEYTKQADAPGTETEIGNQPMNFIDGNTYSENEVIIGQWINGKPIYRKVVKIASPTNGGKYNHNILNLEEVVKVSGYVKNGSAFEPINTNANRDYYTGIYDISDTYFYYTCGSWKTTNLNVVFEYTKTTDEPQDMTVTSTLTTTATDEEVLEVFA